MIGDIVMGKKYGKRLALWILPVFLLAALLSGCGSKTAPEREMPFLPETVTSDALQPEDKGQEAFSIKGTEADADGNDGTKSADAGSGETESPETGEDETKPADAGVDEGRQQKEDDKTTEGSLQPKEDGRPAGGDSRDVSGRPTEEVLPKEEGSYISRDEVALYLYTYGHLPDNFITKNEAKKLGWDNSKGNLAKVAPGKSIGGDRFGNYEGLLPDKDGRSWTECDIGYEEGYRNGERIVFSNDGLIYYTGDHYKSFERLY